VTLLIYVLITAICLLLIFHFIKITALTKENKRLLENNLRFEEAQELINIGSWEWDITNNTLVWSDEIYRIFGLKPQQFAATYDAFINTVHIDDRNLVEDAVSNALKTGDNYSIVHRIVLPNGDEKTVLEKAVVELGSDNKPLRMIGTVEDITNRYEKEKELKLQSKILNYVTDSIFVHDLDGSFIYVNDSAYRSRGYTKEELLGMKVKDLDHHDESVSYEILEQNIKNMKAKMKKHGQVIFEISHKTKDGKIIPLEITSRIVHDNEGNYVISIARDITERKAMHKNLEASEKQYRELVENSQIGIYSSKINGDISYVNCTTVKMLGFETQEEMYKFKTISRYKNPEQRSHFLRELSKNGRVENMELNLLTKDNEEKIILMSAYMDNEFISGIIMDITETKKAIEEITKLSRAVEEIDDIIMITDRSGILTFVNDAYVQHTGFSREESIGKTASILKSARHDKQFYKNMWTQIIAGETFRGLVTNRKKDGEVYYEEKTITPIKNDANEIISFVSTGKDITGMVELQYDLERLASTDQLTGIYNRHKFEEFFTHELERAQRYGENLSLIMFDIDYFKSINDTYGHDVGDIVLQKIAEVTKRNIRNTDIFARWGGEEFLILCPQTDSQKCAILAEKLRIEVEAYSFEKVKHITASFGVTSYIAEDNLDTFTKRVDNALYMAKDSGRNKVISL